MRRAAPFEWVKDAPSVQDLAAACYCASSSMLLILASPNALASADREFHQTELSTMRVSRMVADAQKVTFAVRASSANPGVTVTLGFGLAGWPATHAT
jgi:hypothetical protein